MDEQRKLILDQFTRQALPFSEMHARDDREIHQLLIDAAGVTPSDEVLDVACGPGLVACEIAREARHVTGIDLTPAMIDQARERQRSLGLANLTWTVGDALPLPFPDAAFSCVVTRYSFHHFAAPDGVFDEMVRVCRPGGTVAVCDVFTTSPEQAELYDRLEKFRDPSHTHSLLLAEFEPLFARLKDVRKAFYRYPVKVDELLARSFPDEGGADRFREMVRADVGVNRIGINATAEGWFSFPVVIFAGKK